jgi:transcriptional regulator with XRE-family HTH domain
MLRQLKGQTPVSALATQSGFSRCQVSRWLSGSTQPNLSELFCLVEVSSRRLLDLLALLVNPERLPSVARRWQKLELARKVAYGMPWSHAVLRALEIQHQA